MEVDGLAQSTLENIWKKAETLVKEGHVVAVPWSADAKNSFVKSSSSAVPHLVRKDAKKRSYETVQCSRDSRYALMSWPLQKLIEICSHSWIASRVRVHPIYRPLLIMRCQVEAVAREE